MCAADLCFDATAAFTIGWAQFMEKTFEHSAIVYVPLEAY
jgi:hypothetical protein